MECGENGSRKERTHRNQGCGTPKNFAEGSLRFGEVGLVAEGCFSREREKIPWRKRIAAEREL